MAIKRDLSVARGGRGQEEAPAVNKYYLRISGRFMIAKYLSILVLVVFLGFMLIRYNDDITYANMMYLLRDFNTGVDVNVSGFENIEYDEQENMSFSIYRGELCVIGNRTLKMYNVRGDESRSYDHGYSNPAIVSSDKYLLAYGIGGTEYSVYNSIARVHRGDAPGNITAAHMNSKGEILILCRSKDTKYTVCTFDSSFRQIANYHKSKYVTSAAIGEDAQVVTASFDSNGTAYECEIELYFDGSEKPDASYTAKGVFPVKCGIFQSGEYYVICTDRVLFFDQKGKFKTSVESAREYTAYAQSKDRLALSCNNDSLGGTSNVILFDTAGSILYNQSVNGSVSSLAVTTAGVSALTGNRVYNVTDEGTVAFDVPAGGSVILSAGDSSVLCYKNGTSGINYKEPDNSSKDKAVTD